LRRTISANKRGFAASGLGLDEKTPPIGGEPILDAGEYPIAPDKAAGAGLQFGKEIVGRQLVDIDDVALVAAADLLECVEYLGEALSW